MATIKKFEDLEIWQKARYISKEIYALTNQDAFSKDFRFRDQNFSSGSCMDNIAEGFEREGNREFIQFLSIAKGSIGETRSQLTRALDANYILEEKYNDLIIKCTELSKNIAGFMKYLKSSELKGNKFQEPEEEYKADNNFKSQTSNFE